MFLRAVELLVVLFIIIEIIIPLISDKPLFPLCRSWKIFNQIGHLNSELEKAELSKRKAELEQQLAEIEEKEKNTDAKSHLS